MASRKTLFIGIMAALKTAMFIISQTILRSTQTGRELSHIGTLTAAVFGGPWVGLLTGLLVGIGFGFYFGYIGGCLECSV